MDYFNKVNGEYVKYFNGNPKPSRSCVAVKELPKKAKVEIECVALA